MSKEFRELGSCEKVLDEITHVHFDNIPSSLEEAPIKTIKASTTIGIYGKYNMFNLFFIKDSGECEVVIISDNMVKDR